MERNTENGECVRIKLSNIRCNDPYEQEKLEVLKAKDPSSAIKQIESFLEHQEIIISFE